MKSLKKGICFFLFFFSMFSFLRAQVDIYKISTDSLKVNTQESTSKNNNSKLYIKAGTTVSISKSTIISAEIVYIPTDKKVIDNKVKVSIAKKLGANNKKTEKKSIIKEIKPQILVKNQINQNYPTSLSNNLIKKNSGLVNYQDHFKSKIVKISFIVNDFDLDYIITNNFSKEIFYVTSNFNQSYSIRPPPLYYL